MGIEGEHITKDSAKYKTCKHSKLAIIKKKIRTQKANALSRKFQHEKIRADHKENVETLLLSGHNDINQNGMFTSVKHRNFVVIRIW